MEDFRDLVVWHMAHRLTLDEYQGPKQLPNHEGRGLISQIRRASASIAANLAQSCGRSGPGDFHRFLNIAAGSTSELEYQLLLAHDLGYLQTTTYDRLHEQVVEVKRMLASLIDKVEADCYADSAAMFRG